MTGDPRRKKCLERHVAARRILARWLSLLRRMMGSALRLAGSLLFCAAVVLGSLTTGNADSRSTRLGQRAQAIERRTKRLEMGARPAEAVHAFEIGENTLVIRVSAGSR